MNNSVFHSFDLAIVARGSSASDISRFVNRETTYVSTTEPEYMILKLGPRQIKCGVMKKPRQQRKCIKHRMV